MTSLHILLLIAALRCSALPLSNSSSPPSHLKRAVPSCDGTKNIWSEGTCTPCELYTTNGLKAWFGTDAFKTFGCISPTTCPPGGSWSVSENACACLDGKRWDSGLQQCVSEGTVIVQPQQPQIPTPTSVSIQTQLPQQDIVINTICSGVKNIYSDGKCIPCAEYEYNGKSASFSTDAFGTYGCISPYSCPTGGSWSVLENKCRCLPDTPFWNDNACSTEAQPAGIAPTNPSGSGETRRVVYIDAPYDHVPTGFELSVPGYADNAYNIIVLAFWLDTGGAWDVLNGWTQLSDDTRQEYLKAYHNAGKKLLVSAFGASEWPTTAGVDPAVSANNVADFVIKWGFDGVDLDYEDSGAFSAGTAEQWLITYTRVLRQRLPSPQYIVSHAPQAPYFFAGVYSGGGYLAIHQAVGDLIDFYNVQYYNQGSASYDTCETLFYQAGAWAAGSSVFEIAAAGVPLNKIVVGKPITPQGAANTGYMDAYSMAACFPDAKSKGWNGGVMGWQYSLDPSFNWISVLSASL